MSKAALRPKSSSLAFFLAVLLLVLAGCGRSGPTSYYQLAPMQGPQLASRPPAGAELAIGIGPIRVQEHLDRPQLVLRTGTTRLHLADRHRWAEPLAANIAWVLRDNLADLLSTERFFLHPWERTTPLTHQVSMEVLRCEGGEDGTAQLEVLWTVADREGREMRPPRRSSYAVPLATADEGGLVNGLSEALALLSREIAGELSQTSPAAGR